jgi:hypothetical protein
MVTAALGLDPGREEDRKPGDERNPRGFFELDPLMTFSREAAAVALAPLLGRSGFATAQWREAPGVAALIDHGRMVWERVRTSGDMVVKLPDGGGIPLAFWREIFGDSSAFVVPFRNPLEVAASRARFRHDEAGSRTETAWQLYSWARYHQGLFPQLEGSAVFFLEYGQLLADPLPVIVDLATTLQTWGFNVDAAHQESALALVDPTLHRSPVQPLPWWFPRPRTEALYRALQNLQGGHGHFSRDGIPADGFDFYSRLSMKALRELRRIRSAASTK